MEKAKEYAGQIRMGMNKKHWVSEKRGKCNYYRWYPIQGGETRNKKQKPKKGAGKPKPKQEPTDQQQEKYCRCRMHVAGKNSDECNARQAWKETKNRRSDCVNPFAVCGKISHTSNSCVNSMDFTGITRRELYSYALVKGKKEINKRMTRAQLIQVLKETS